VPEMRHYEPHFEPHLEPEPLSHSLSLGGNMPPGQHVLEDTGRKVRADGIRPFNSIYLRLRGAL
jgi:hypothetical protein